MRVNFTLKRLSASNSYSYYCYDFHAQLEVTCKSSMQLPRGLDRTTCATILWTVRANLGGLVTNATGWKLAMPLIMYALFKHLLDPYQFHSGISLKTKICFQDICECIYSCHTRKGVLWSAPLNPI